MFGLENAANLIADIAPTYFASIAVLVSAFFAADAVGKKMIAMLKMLPLLVVIAGSRLWLSQCSG